MASVAQVRANRLNAQKSTGPRTPEGKAVVAQNAVKHGLLAQQVVIRGEDPGEFELFRDRMVQDLDPAGPLESLLAERVAHLGWRLRRAQRLENSAWETLVADYVAKEAAKVPVFGRAQGVGQAEGEAGGEEESVLGRVVVKDFGNAKVLDQLLVYERRIENSLYRTVSELRKQRLLREAECSEYRLQAGQESVAAAFTRRPDGGIGNTRVNAELQTETPGGVTTNGAEVEEPFDQTKPKEGPGAKGEGAREHEEKVCDAHPTGETPYDVTTNGAEAEGLSCETNPICGSNSEDRGSGDVTVEEVGRGRPSYEEASDDATTNEETPYGVTTNSETKPKEVSSVKCEVSSDESPATSEPG